MDRPASRTVSVTFSANDPAENVVISTDPIIVYGILWTSSTSAVYENASLARGTGNAANEAFVYAEVRMPAGISQVHNIPFIADKGLEITHPYATTPATKTVDSSVTVFFSSTA